MLEDLNENLLLKYSENQKAFLSSHILEPERERYLLICILRENYFVKSTFIVKFSI
jgi:hypothetical protein